MAPFVHISTDRPGRFTDGTYGVYSAGDGEEPGWTSQFRMLINRLDLDLHDARPYERYHDPDDYKASHALGQSLRASGANGIVYRSMRSPGGECAAIFWPDLRDVPVQADHFDFHWDGERVDRVRNCRSNAIFAL